MTGQASVRWAAWPSAEHGTDAVMAKIVFATAPALRDTGYRLSLARL